MVAKTPLHCNLCYHLNHITSYTIQRLRVPIIDHHFNTLACHTYRRLYGPALSPVTKTVEDPRVRLPAIIPHPLPRLAKIHLLTVRSKLLADPYNAR